VLRVARVQVHDRRARLGGLDGRLGNLLRRDGEIWRHGRRVDRTGDRARDDDFALRCCHSWIRYPGGRTMKAIILGILLAFALPAAAERAASIDYEFVPRPASLPADYDGPGLRFLAIIALDGARVDAALWQPPNAKTLVLMVHGSGESYHGNPNGFLGKALAQHGYAVLAINTRQ